jgi:hypothetical protein
LRRITDQSHAARAAAPEPYHGGGGAGLLDKYQSRRVQHALLSDPAPACARQIGTLLLGRLEMPFLEADPVCCP